MDMPSLQNLRIASSDSLKMMRRGLQGGSSAVEDSGDKCEEWFRRCKDGAGSLSDELDAAMRELADAYVPLGKLEELEPEGILCRPVELAHGLLHTARR